MQKVLLAFSGGIDSFMAALILKNQGYQVEAVNFRLFTPFHYDENQEIEEIKKKAAALGIRVHFVNLKKELDEKVIRPFLHAYLKGLTPSPCSLCNRVVKWAHLKRYALDNGFQKIATGHYIKIKKSEDNFFVHKGKDPIKDQSYFLWELNNDMLSMAMTPLGEYTKSEIRHMAREYGFKKIIKKSESMGVCFLEGRNYRQLLKERINIQTDHKGKILDEQMNEIGHHLGIYNYTIGQKKDLFFHDSRHKGWQVKKIIRDKNSLVAAPMEHLMKDEFFIHQLNFNGGIPKNRKISALQLVVRGYGNNPSGTACIEFLNEQLARVKVSEPVWALTPGQPAVFYKGNRLVGGGILIKDEKSLPNN